MGENILHNLKSHKVQQFATLIPEYNAPNQNKQERERKEVESGCGAYGNHIFLFKKQNRSLKRGKRVKCPYLLISSDE